MGYYGISADTAGDFPMLRAGFARNLASARIGATHANAPRIASHALIFPTAPGNTQSNLKLELDYLFPENSKLALQYFPHTLPTSTLLSPTTHPSTTTLPEQSWLLPIYLKY